MTVFFTADTHFGHANIVERFNRGNGLFKSIQHHDALIQQHWFETVTDDDDVYVLGDIALGVLEESLKKFEILPGRKFLVPGNHDRIISLEGAEKVKKNKPFYENVGFTVLEETVHYNVPTVYGDQEVLLSHFPYAVTEFENTADRWKKVRPINAGLPLIHGHTHSTNQFNPVEPLEFHVGVDANNFTPVALTEIQDWLVNLKDKQLI